MGLISGEWVERIFTPKRKSVVATYLKGWGLFILAIYRILR